MFKSSLLLALSVALLATSAWAEPGKVEFKADDSVQSLLERQVGQRVELHLKNGEKFAGKLESVTSKSIHLSALTGQEFFDAVIVTEEVSAVLVRTH